VDLDKGEWRYTTTKTNTPHIVPLARQVVKILSDLKPLTYREWRDKEGQLDTGYLFPGDLTGNRPMSDVALTVAMRWAGIPKGFHELRAMARTLLAEVLHFPAAVIELQLGHLLKDANGKGYDRAAFLPERRDMMQKWADYLDALKTGNANEPALA
jgi:integrase